MNPAAVAALIGASIFAYAWTRLWLWIMKRFAKLIDPARIYGAYGVAWFTAVFLGAASFAEGGPWDWARALVSYTPPMLAFLALDLVRLKARRLR